MSIIKHTLLDSAVAGTCSLLPPAPGISQGIISRAVITTPGLRVTWFQFAPGQELSEHTSKARALVQVLSGGCRFSVDGQDQALRAGDLLHLPPGLPHAVTATEDFTMLLIQSNDPEA